MGGFLPDSVRDLRRNTVPVVIGTERGLKVLTRVILGVDVDRIKNLAALHSSNKFEKMTDQELEHGKVRVSDWTKSEISVGQAFS